MGQFSAVALSYPVRRMAVVCELTTPRTMLTDLRLRFQRAGLTEAVERHDTPALFDWLVQVLSYQGVSDAVAWTYMDHYGSITHVDIEGALRSTPSCPKLRSHWHFDECRFAKAAFTCSQPEHMAGCPLPHHDLRSGRLNQTAYSLFLFLRDVCDGDLVRWIDERMIAADQPSDPDRGDLMGQALIEPLTAVYGVSFKVLSMALADLLLACGENRERWATTGASMIVVDTLVHNWLHRTGCLHELEATHRYGPACYQLGGCAEIISSASRAIDARGSCPEGPAFFPRLVQKALWLFCTEEGLGMCNGNRIDDWQRCRQTNCPMFAGCQRIPLNGLVNSARIR